jgi:type I restriction enzyme S subunit
MCIRDRECRWSFIASIKSANELFETIKTGVTSFRQNAKTKPFFRPHEIQKCDIVHEIVQQINRISYKTLQETDALGDIFEYMIGRGMSTMSDEGQYFTNRTICKLAFKLSFDVKKTLRRDDGSLCTFADWFCGTGGFPAEYVKGVRANLDDVNWEKDFGSIYCQDMNISSVTTTLLNMLILTGIPFSSNKIRSSNSFSDPIITGENAPFPNLSIDYCFMNPPYGGDKTKGKEYKFTYMKKIKDENGTTTKVHFVNKDIQSIGIEDDDKVSAGVQLAMATLSVDGGICAIVLPQGFFFHSSKKMVELRKRIAEEYKIHYVVDIASGAFVNTGTKTSMMVFQRGVGATEKVAFIGLDETLIIEATLDQLRAKAYSLNFKQYMPQDVVEIEGFDMVKLGDIVTISTGKNKTPDNKQGTLYPYYGTSGITGYTDHFLEDGEYIMTARNGTIGNTFLISGKTYPSDHMFIIKTTDRCLLKYLYYWIDSNKRTLEHLSNVTTIPGITKESLINMPIPLPSIERQQSIVESIVGWSDLIQQEETSLSMLERQIMRYVDMLGRGQPRVKLESIANEFTFGFAIKSGDYCTEGVPVIKTKNIKSKRISYPTDYQKITTVLDERYKIKRGDLIIVLGGSPGENGIWNFNEEAWLNQDCVKISFDNSTTKMFVFYSLQGRMFSEYIESNTKKTTIGHVDRGIIKGIEIPLPPLDVQQTLQSDFDEVVHKHEKIAEYRSKEQAAICALIPGAYHS